MLEKLHYFGDLLKDNFKVKKVHKLPQSISKLKILL